MFYVQIKRDNILHHRYTESTSYLNEIHLRV